MIKIRFVCYRSSMSDKIPSTPPPSVHDVRFHVEYRKARHFDVSDLARIAIERHAQNERPVLLSSQGHFFVSDYHSNTRDLKSALIAVCQEIYRRCHGDEARIHYIHEQAGLDENDFNVTAMQIKILNSLLGE